MSFREKSTRRDLKAGLNSNELRAKRTENAVSLRKQEREEQLARRRKQVDTDEDEEAATVTQNYDEQQLAEYVTFLKHPDPEQVYLAVRKLRQLLSLERNPPIDDIVALNAVPILINLLSHPNTKIVFESAWSLTNIASGTTENTRAVVEAGGIPLFVQLLSSEDDDVRDQAVWALGNISGESHEYRDLVLAHNAMEKLLHIAHMQLKLAMLRNIAWSISNLCRGRKPHPDFNKVSIALPTLYNMIHFSDPDVMGDACWAISYLSDDIPIDGMPENQKIQAVIESGVVPRLVQLLGNTSFHIKTPALRAIGNIVTGNNAQTDVVLQAGALPALTQLLDSSRRSIRKETCWALSNILAGSLEQVQKVRQANIFIKLIEMIPSADVTIRKEIAYCFNNTLVNHNYELLTYLIHIGLIPALSHLLRTDDSDLQNVVLETVENILSMGKAKFNSDENEITQHIESSQLLEAIEQLQINTQNQNVYNNCFNIMTKYFQNLFDTVGEDEQIGEMMNEQPANFDF